MPSFSSCLSPSIFFLTFTISSLGSKKEKKGEKRIEAKEVGREKKKKKGKKSAATRPPYSLSLISFFTPINHRLCPPVLPARKKE